MTSLWPASKGEEGGEKRDRGYEKEGKLPPPPNPAPLPFLRLPTTLNITITPFLSDDSNFVRSL